MRTMHMLAVAWLVAGVVGTAMAGEVYIKDDRFLDELIGRTARLEVERLNGVNVRLSLSIANPALCGGEYAGEGSLDAGVASFEDSGCTVSVAFADGYVDVKESPAPCMTPDCPLEGRYWAEGSGPERSEEEVVADIRDHYVHINNSIAMGHYVEVAREVVDQSTEGGEMTAWIADGDYLKKIAMTLYGEMGKDYREYYFWDNDLLFCYQAITLYDAYLSGEGKLEEYRFYFDKGTMVRWLTPEEGGVLVGRGWEDMAQDVLYHARLNRDLAMETYFAR